VDVNNLNNVSSSVIVELSIGFVSVVIIKLNLNHLRLHNLWLSKLLIILVLNLLLRLSPHGLLLLILILILLLLLINLFFKIFEVNDSLAVVIIFLLRWATSLPESVDGAMCHLGHSTGCHLCHRIRSHLLEIKGGLLGWRLCCCGTRWLSILLRLFSCSGSWSFYSFATVNTIIGETITQAQTK
jgi:hypothetical protein